MSVIFHDIHQERAVSIPDPHQDFFSLRTLGFWIYLMTDCLIFATLFLTYAAFKESTFGGPTSQDLFELTSPFAETMVLLFSTVTCGFALLSAKRSDSKSALLWLFATFLLGSAFLTLELREFSEMIAAGNSFQRSAFLSSFFALVATHGLHITAGLIWLIVMAAQLIFLGITLSTFRRLVLFSLFWHFLDLIWVFIFSFVYLMGVL